MKKEILLIFLLFIVACTASTEEIIQVNDVQEIIPTKVAGQACSQDAECETKTYCSKGICEYTLYYGSSCTRDAECSGWCMDNNKCSLLPNQRCDKSRQEEQCSGSNGDIKCREDPKDDFYLICTKESNDLVVGDTGCNQIDSLNAYHTCKEGICRDSICTEQKNDIKPGQEGCNIIDAKGIYHVCKGKKDICYTNATCYTPTKEITPDYDVCITGTTHTTCTEFFQCRTSEDGVARCMQNSTFASVFTDRGPNSSCHVGTQHPFEKYNGKVTYYYTVCNHATCTWGTRINCVDEENNSVQTPGNCACVPR
jgi:hypothetical protein